MTEHPDRGHEPQQQGDQAAERQDSSQVWGWILIGFGALLLLENIVDFNGSLFLLALGAGFLAAYLNTRNYGLLVPAMILLGLGFGLLLEDVRIFDIRMQWEPFLLGLGFIGIYLTDRIVQGPTSIWPLFPGGILVLVALWDFLDRYDFLWEVQEFLADWWPVLLIALGIYLLRRQRPGEAGSSAQQTGG